MYLFRPLRVYLVDNPSNKTMSTSKKQCLENNKWMIMPLQTKKTCISMNPLKLTIDES